MREAFLFSFFSRVRALWNFDPWALLWEVVGAWTRITHSSFAYPWVALTAGFFWGNLNIPAGRQNIPRDISALGIKVTARNKTGIPDLYLVWLAGSLALPAKNCVLFLFESLIWCASGLSCSTKKSRFCLLSLLLLFLSYPLFNNWRQQTRAVRFIHNPVWFCTPIYNSRYSLLLFR